jgi:hypothetical protein
MKTNVVMYRPLGDIKVYQRTKDAMFNATSFIKQFNSAFGFKKELKDYFSNKSTLDLIESMNEDDEFLHGGKYPYVKSRASRGDNAGTWMHPYLFIDFAMWLNPKFKLKVIKFVYDELIKNRHSAGDNYKLLSASGVKLDGYSFKDVATAMNYIVFDRKGKNLRQHATQEQLKELSDIQTKLSFAIDMGYIKTYSMLMEDLREMYRIKKRKTPF